MAHDRATPAHNGTISGGVTLGQAASPFADGSTAMLFPGNPGQIALPSLNPGASFSLEIWVKRTLPGNQDQCLFQVGSAGLYILGSSTNTLELVNSAGVVGVSTSVINDALWHHVVVTYDGATMHMFIDGIDVSGTTTVHAAGAAVGFIGNGQFTNFTKALLKAAAWYPLILTPTQVVNHFNLSKTSLFNSLGATVGGLDTAGVGSNAVLGGELE